MKKTLIVFLLVIVLLVSIVGIYKLLVSEDLEDDILTTTTTNLIESETGYDEIIITENYRTFIINKEDLSDIELELPNVKFTLTNDILKINDKEIIKDVSINRDFAIYYEKTLVLNVTHKKHKYSAFIIYNIYEKEYEIVSKMDDMFIDDEYQFLDNGILINLKIVEEALFLTEKEAKDLCKIKLSNETIVKSSLIYIYDAHKKKFSKTEPLSNITYESYITSNNLCN